MNRQIKRGEVYYVTRNYTEVGSEQQAGRPAIIVSNDSNNAHSNVVELVYLTTQPKNNLPTHCQIQITDKVSTVLCEQVNSIFVDRLDGYMATVSPEDMEKVDKCLAISLALGSQAAESEPEDIKALKAERDFYEKQYKELLDRLIGGRR